MNQCVSYFIGFLMGAAVIKVLGLVARGRWLALFFCFAVDLHAANVSVIYHNTSAVNMGGANQIEIRINGLYGNAAIAGNASLSAGATSGTTAIDTARNGDAYEARKMVSGVWGSWYGVYTSTGTAAQTFHAYWDGTFSLPASYTNSVVSDCFTVTWPGDYEVRWLACGLAIGELSFPNKGVGDVICFTNNVTDGCHLSYYIVGPGGADTDYVFKTWQDGDGTDTVTPTDPGSGGGGTGSGGATDNDSVDSDTTPRTPNSGTATDPRIPDRENAEAIVKAVDRAKNEISATIRTGANAITNAIDHASTNNTGGAGTNDYTALLQQIATNTLNTADRMTSLTNQIDGAFGISTNINAYSNAVISMISFSAASNIFNASAIAGVVDDAISGVKGSATNASTAFSLSGNPLEFSIAKTSGGYAHLNVGLVSTINDSPTVSGIRAKLYTFLNWIRSWFLALIPWVMFWLVMWSSLKWQEEIQLAFLHNLPTVSANISVVGLLSKAFTIQLVIKAATVIVSALIGFVPTLIVAHAQGLVYGAGFQGAIPDIRNHLDGGGGGFFPAAQAFYNALLEVLPMTTVIFSAVHYLAYQLYGKRLILFTITILTYILPAVRIAILFSVLSWSSSIGAEVEILNLSGTNVVFAKGGKALTVPPGQLSLNLDAGAWTVDGASLTVPATEDRFYVRCEQSGFSTSMGESDWSWFWAGFQHGIVVFGTVSMVSSLMYGVRLAIRRSFPGMGAD